MAARRRWIMTGPWPHPKTGILYFRKATPPDLLKNRKQLEEMGEKISGEVQRSLRTKDLKPAERLYKAVSCEVEAEWDRLRSLLRDGPVDLSHKDIVALAGEYSESFLKRHEDNPQLAPTIPALFITTLLDNLRWSYSQRSIRDGQLIFELRQELSNLAGIELVHRVTFLLETEHKGPRLDALKAIATALITFRELVGETLAVTLAKRKGITITKRSQIVLAKRVAEYQGKAWDKLQAYVDGDYSPPAWTANLPKFEAVIQLTTASTKKHVVTFNAIITAQAKKRKAGEGSKPLPEKSIKKYKMIAKAFEQSRGSDDATTVTLDEAEEWSDSMVHAGKISNRTINDRLGCLGTIMTWGMKQREHREAMASAEVITGRIELPSYVEKLASDSSYRMDEARIVLLAARLEVDNSKRWLPWLCLYAGLRISEANTLRKSDFFEAEGTWFLKVTSVGKRSLKTASSERYIPLHSALVVEGLPEWVSKAPEGQLFRNGATSLIGRWVRTVGLSREGLAPNHGLRHLFVALCRRHGVEDGAKEYLAGHSNQSIHAKYGAAEVMLPHLAKEIEKIEPLLSTPT